jgi:uncharacterized protein
LSSESLSAFIRALPKVELHVHLVGSAGVDTVLALARRHREAGVPTDRAELEQFFTFRDFDHFLKVYWAVLQWAVGQNPLARAVLDYAAQLGLTSCYLGAGAVTQTVWNLEHRFEPTYGIRDYDLVYFDSSDLSVDAERAVEEQANRALGDIGAGVDVTNEARVHLWYAERFGRPIPPYVSTEHAVSTWPTTASSVAVADRPDGFEVCAPFGLSDLFAMTVRPNKAIISEAVYRGKADRWKAQWPGITVLPW